MDVDGDGGRREFVRSDEGPAASGSTAFDPLVEFL